MAAVDGGRAVIGQRHILGVLPGVRDAADDLA